MHKAERTRRAALQNFDIQPLDKECPRRTP
jgi:hypothetical protein